VRAIDHPLARKKLKKNKNLCLKTGENMTTVRPGLTHAFSLALCLTICLGIVHAPLQAKIYNLTENPTKDTQVIREYKLSGNKSFTVKNNSCRQQYIRIGYEGIDNHLCNFTGFVLDPGQTGKVHKSPVCIPAIVSAGDTTIKQWKNQKTGPGREDRLGDFMWTVEPTKSGLKIEYQGKWAPDSQGTNCWEGDMGHSHTSRSDYRTTCP
jgi:hypothetical protein